MVHGKKPIADFLALHSRLVMTPPPVVPGPRGRLEPSSVTEWCYIGQDPESGMLMVQGQSGITVKIPDGLLIGADLLSFGLATLKLGHAVLIYGSHYHFVGMRIGGRGFLSDLVPLDKIVLDPNLPQNNSGLFAMAAAYAQSTKKALVLQIGADQEWGVDLAPMDAGDRVWALIRPGGPRVPIVARQVSAIFFIDLAKIAVA